MNLFLRNAGSQPGILAAVIAGVERHTCSTISTPRYCHNDARLVLKSLESSGRLSTRHTTLLLDEDATRERILDRLRELSRDPAVQGLVFYFAGHGLSLDGENYLLPCEGRITPRQVAETCLSLADCLSACESDRGLPVLAVIDACRSGLTPQWTETRPYFKAAGLDRLKPPAGTNLLIGAGPDMTGLVSHRLHHGVFTLHLAEALADSANWAEGFPQAGRLLRSVSPQVREYSARQYFRITQPWPEEADEAAGGDGEDTGELLPRLIPLFKSKRSDKVATLIRKQSDWEQDPGLLTAMSVVSRLQGDLPSGEEYTRRAIDLDRHYAHAYLTLANIQLLNREYCAAEETYQLAIRLDEHMAAAHYGLGTVQCYRNNLAAALMHYLTAIRVSPCWAMPHTGVGYVYHKLGQVEAAVDEYREAIQLDPEYYYTYYSMGRALKEFERLELAEANQRECLRLKPDFTGSLYELGDILRLQHQPVEAMHFYRESLKTDEGYVPAYYGMATLHSAEGRDDLALEQLEKALHFDPASARTHQRMAEVHLNLGRLDPARHHAKLAASFAKPGDEEYPECQRILRQVAEPG